MLLNLALVAAAVANPEISTNAEGDVVIGRRQEVAVGELQSTVESLMLEVSALKEAATGASSPLLIGVNAG